MNIMKFNNKLALYILLLIILVTTTGLANAEENLKVAQVVKYSGDVKVMKSGGEKAFSVFEKMALSQGDLLITGKESTVTIKTDDEIEIKIAENSQVMISELIEENEQEKASFKLWAGGIWANLKNKLSVGSKFEIETPTAVMGVRGTKFYAKHQEGKQILAYYQEQLQFLQ